MTDKPVAIVTGGSRGIGAAIARTLASLGARTVLCGRNRKSLESAAADIQSRGGQSSVMECDVTDLRSVELLVERVDRTFERLDVLVNNAGIGGSGGPLHQLAPEVWDDVLNTNLRGVYYCIRSFAPLMIRARSGHIINISSIAGKNALPNGAAYAAFVGRGTCGRADGPKAQGETKGDGFAHGAPLSHWRLMRYKSAPRVTVSQNPRAV